MLSQIALALVVSAIALGIYLLVRSPSSEKAAQPSEPGSNKPPGRVDLTEFVPEMKATARPTKTNVPKLGEHPGETTES